MAPRFKYSGVVPSVSTKSWSHIVSIGTPPIVVYTNRLSPLSGQCLLCMVLVLGFYLPLYKYCIRTWAPPAPQD
jgi:hypothetical protein